MAVTAVDLNLWEVGEDQQPPAQWGFTFVAGRSTFVGVLVSGCMSALCAFFFFNFYFLALLR